MAQNYTIYTKMELTWTKNPPRDLPELLKKVSIIIEEYDGYLHLKDLIFYLYVATATQVICTPLDSICKYNGEISGVYNLGFQPDLRDQVENYSYHSNSNSLSPHFSIFFDMSIRKSPRPGGIFKHEVWNKNRGHLKTKELIEIMKKDYGLNTVKHDSNIIIQN